MRGFEQQIVALGYGRSGESLLRDASDIAADHPFAGEIRRMFAPREHEASASAVYLNGSVPLACLVDSETLPQGASEQNDAIRRLCRRLWNQNLASVVLVLGSDQVKAYSVLNPNASVKSVPANASDRSEGPWSQADLSSGRMWERESDWFDPKLRVDTDLLTNIVALLETLCNSKNRLSEDEARYSVAKAIFACFLEQRGIVGDTYRTRHDTRTLAQLISERDRPGLMKLFGLLRENFNGDFLKATPENQAAEFWELSDDALTAIGDFLKRTDLKTGQHGFWGYDFSEIPIELISGIYQTFLSTKGQLANIVGPSLSPGTIQKKLGAFYTPRHLAVYVVEQAFQRSEEPLSEKIFDGACGSGILLTTAYRHLLRHFELRHGRPAFFDERRKILLNSIFGSDIDLDACRLTAFSLYLALLSDLTPQDLVLIAEQGGQLPSLIGKNLRAGLENGDVFGPPTVASSKGKYTLVISNPPWREPDAGEETSFERWLALLSSPPAISYRQTAIAYVFRALDCLKRNGRVALILPLRLIVGDRAQDFREELAEWMSVDSIVNFADMRRLIFPGATHPFVVLTGSPRSSKERIAIRAGKLIPGEGETIEYLVPKADVALAYGQLAIHGDDRITLPASSLHDKERLFGLRYWGTEHDVALLRRIRRLGQIGDLLKTTVPGKPAWRCNSGWVAPYKGYPGSDVGEIGKLPFLDARELAMAGMIVAGRDESLRAFPNEFEKIAFHGETELYRGPRVLWPDGVSTLNGIRSVFADTPFSFRHSIKAIGGPEQDRSLLQFLTIYLRSPLAKYLMILSSHSVAGERPKLHINDLLGMPFVRPELHPDPDQAANIVRRAGVLFDLAYKLPPRDRSSALNVMAGEFNELVETYFGVDADDAVLIREMVDCVAPSIQPTSTQPKTLLTALLKPPGLDDLEAYRVRLRDALLAWRNGANGTGRIDVKIEYNFQSLLGAAVIELSDARTDEQDRVQAVQSKKLLENIESSFDDHASRSPSAMLNLPQLTIAAGTKILLIKPLRQRFWLERTALADADRLVAQIRSTSQRKLSS